MDNDTDGFKIEKDPPDKSTTCKGVTIATTDINTPDSTGETHSAWQNSSPCQSPKENVLDTPHPNIVRHFVEKIETSENGNDKEVQPRTSGRSANRSRSLGDNQFDNFKFDPLSGDNSFHSLNYVSKDQGFSPNDVQSEVCQDSHSPINTESAQYQTESSDEVPVVKHLVGKFESPNNPSGHIIEESVDRKDQAWNIPEKWSVCSSGDVTSLAQSLPSNVDCSSNPTKPIELHSKGKDEGVKFEIGCGQFHVSASKSPPAKGWRPVSFNCFNQSHSISDSRLPKTCSEEGVEERDTEKVGIAQSSFRFTSDDTRKVRRLHGKSHPLTKLSQKRTGGGPFHYSM